METIIGFALIAVIALIVAIGIIGHMMYDDDKDDWI